jgi:hypothetical protein
VEWSLEPDTASVAISGAGCANSYVLLGAPGSGKTHLMLQFLQDIIDFDPDNPQQQFGGLILDPKSSMIDDVRRMLRGHPKEKDLVVIDGSRTQLPVNVISCASTVPELARLLVLAARSAGVDAREPFWFLAWTNLFSAAMTLLEYYDQRELTLARIMEAIMTTDGTREIQTIAEELSSQAEAYAETYAENFPARSSREIAGDIRRAAAEIRSFYNAKADYVSTIEAFLINAYGPFSSERCHCFSPDYRRPLMALQQRSSGILTLYDSILEEGKIVVVSLPPSEPGLAKTLCTLIKCLFQQTVLGRRQRIRAGELTNWERVVFLACDEYSEIASEVPGQAGDGRFFGLARENGCMGLLATQSVHVLENSSLREAWRSVFSVFAAKIFFSLNDLETARYASELVGKADWQLRTATTSRSADGLSVSVQRELRERETAPTTLLTETLTRGQALVIGSLDGREDVAKTGKGSQVTFVQVPKKGKR